MAEAIRVRGEKHKRTKSYPLANFVLLVERVGIFWEMIGKFSDAGFFTTWRCFSQGTNGTVVLEVCTKAIKM